MSTLTHLHLLYAQAKCGLTARCDLMRFFSQVHVSLCVDGTWVEALKGEVQGEATEGVALLRGLGLSVPLRFHPLKAVLRSDVSLSPEQNYC